MDNPLKKKRIYPTGPSLRSLRLFPGEKRKYFPIGLLRAKKLDDMADDIENLILAVQAAEADVYELRRRFDKQKETLIRQVLHEMLIRRESLRINKGDLDTVTELTSIIAFTKNLKL